MADSTNRFFDSWTANERAALERHLKPIELQQHYVLFDIHEAVSKIVFPTSTGARVQHLERGEDSLAHNIEQATRCLKPLGRPSVGSKQPLGGEPSSAKDHWPQCD